MAGFSWMGFTQGAMEGAMNIADQRRKQADDYFKRLDGIYEKTRLEKIKADQQLASATALAKQYNVDTSYVINAQLQELKGNDLIEYLQRAKPKSGTTSVADVKAQTDKILGLDTLAGGVEQTQSIQKPATPDQQAVMNSPEAKTLETTVQNTQPTDTTVAQKSAQTAPSTGPASPMIPSMGKGPETNGTGALGAVSNLLFGPTARDRAMSQFEDTYGKDAVAYLNHGGKSAYMQEASKPSKFDVGPKKTDFSKIVEKLTPGDFRTREDYARFTALVEQGKYQEAMAIPMDFDTRKKIETQSAIAASTAAAAAVARAQAQYGQQGVLNLVNPKTGEMTAVNSRDGDAIKRLTGQGFVEATNYSTVKEARMTPIERIASKFTRADFNSNEDFAKAAQLIKAGKSEEALMLLADPMAREKSMEEFKAGLKGENKEVNTRTMVHPGLGDGAEGRIRAFLATDKAGVEQAIKDGYVEVPKNWTGKQGDLPNKVETDIINKEVAVRNALSGIGEVKDVLKRNRHANTYAATAAKTISNFAADLNGIVAATGVDLQKLDPSKYSKELSSLDNLGLDSAQLKSAVVNLTYLTAGTYGASGRDLSDKDVAMMADAIGSSIRDGATMEQVMDNVAQRVITNYNNYYRVVKGAYPKDDIFADTKGNWRPENNIPKDDPAKEVKSQPLPLKNGRPDTSKMQPGMTYEYNGQRIRYKADGGIEEVK